MRLVSFDVGIKNLAYCVFSFDANSSPKEEDTPAFSESNSPNKWSIPQWICANLLELNDGSGSTSQPAKPCCHLIKGKRKSDMDHACNKNSKWVAPNNTVCYCENHAKLHDEWILPKKHNSPSHIRKMKLAEAEQEYSKIPQAEGSGKMKKPEMIERIVAYYESKCYRSSTENAEKPKSAGETDLVTIGRAIRQQLDSDISIEGTTHVIIENQISTIAARMKTIQGMIAQYFIMRFGDSVHIEFVSSRNKLKGFEPEKKTESCSASDATQKKTSYKTNKSDGITICRDFFESNPEMNNWLSIFDKSKKRDDLADCFLQGIWYLKSIQIISYAAKLKHKYCVCIINNGNY